MAIMLSLALAGLAFIGIHLGVSGTSVRDALVARFGLQPYMIGFSVASVAAMAWLVAAYANAPYVPSWGQLQWWKPVQLVLMLPAFLLAVAGLATPSPTSVAQEALVDQPPSGILRITRHPFLTGVTIWAVVHLVGNGDVASMLFFASLATVAAAGTVSIDAKRRRSLGAARWERFASRTSIIPFSAILSGRNTLAMPELGWWRPALGVAVYALLLGGHSHLFGVSPFPG